MTEGDAHPAPDGGAAADPTAGAGGAVGAVATRLPAPLARVADGVRRYARACFSIDLRSLGLFRIGLGLIVFIDALTRLHDVEVFYSAAGVGRAMPPGSVLDRVFASPPSLYNIDGSTAFQSALLIVNAIVGLVFLVGYRTRVTSIVLWALQLSVVHRNSWVNTGADAVIIALVTWACLLPVGARFSLDQRRRSTTIGDNVALSWVTFAFVVQMVTIYFFNVVNKNTAPWWRGNAVMIALHIDEHATFIGVFIREHLAFLAKPLTWGTIVAESTPVLLFVPWKNAQVRLFLCATLWALHIGFAACLYLGLFSPVCMVGWLALLPSTAWSRRPLARVEAFFARVINTAPTPPTPPTVTTPPTPPTPTTTTTPPPTTPTPTTVTSPTPTTTPTTPQTTRVSAAVARYAAAALAILLTVMHVGSNIQVTLKTSLLPQRLRTLAASLYLTHPWKMFGSPGVNDGWWVIRGTLSSGREIDVFRNVYDPIRGGARVSFQKPASVAHTYPTSRWRHVMMQASGEERVALRSSLARYFCMDWNRDYSGDNELLTLEMIYVLEHTTRKAVAEKPKPISMLDYDCRSGKSSRRPKNAKDAKDAKRISAPTPTLAPPAADKADDDDGGDDDAAPNP